MRNPFATRRIGDLENEAAKRIGAWEATRRIGDLEIDDIEPLYLDAVTHRMGDLEIPRQLIY